MSNSSNVIAYFSLEIGLSASIPTYSGGLGVLAGDTIKAAADLGLPYVGVTLLYRDGYFTQSLDQNGMQRENATPWQPEKMLEEMPVRTYVPIDGRNVLVRAFRQMYRGSGGAYVPIYFLDTDLPENDEAARGITRALYAGDPDHRIRQEAVLGIAGRRMLRSLSHDVGTFHMNEGHACFLIIELLSEHLARHDKQSIDAACLTHAKARCVFTTHTPVPAGHDRFGIERVRAIIGDHPAFHRPDLYAEADHPEVFNTTVFALNCTRFANGVAKKHGEVSRAMFPGYAIDSITNGVHAPTWVGPAMQKLFDQHVPGWRRSTSDLRLAGGVPDGALAEAHAEAKAALIDRVHSASGVKLSPDRFTIAFARRATAYKRPHMLVSDLDRLKYINKYVCPIQIVYAGKAHPHDHRGKEIIQQVLRAGKELEGHVPLAFVPNYDMDLAGVYTAGADLWLNTPEPPMEASGTSGMKAAMNGVPQLSTLDGWWLEGWIEGVTGWSIEGAGTGDALEAAHAASMYDKLEHAILPLWKSNRPGWTEVMRAAISVNGSYFSTERMVRDYIHKAYLA
jgi:starch phosphorylase